MKKYIVKWGNNEKEFEDVKEAVSFAEKTGEQGANTFVYVERNGIRDIEPFYSCTWSI